MSSIVALEAIESVQHVFLRGISEPTDNSLKIVIEEAHAEGHSSGDVLPKSSTPRTRSAALESKAGCRGFELRWESYVAYLVTQQLERWNAADGYDDETYTGRILRRYTKSHFFDYVARNTGGHPSEILHYRLVCLNHLIDIAAHAAPEIRMISPPPVRKLPASRHIGGIIGPY